MRKIALRGLIGRKWDTVLLWSVVALAFLFLVLTTTILTSLHAADAAQRVQTYGKWQVMASGLSEEGAAALTAGVSEAACTPVLEAYSADDFRAANAFFVGVYSPELADLGQLQLKAGRWPETGNEIALEYARAADLQLEVGDTLKVWYTLSLDPLYVDTPRLDPAVWGLEDLTVQVTAGYDRNTVRLLFAYTICGVVDTYTDRWDSGQTELPGGLITQENFQLLSAGRALAAENCPEYQVGAIDTLALLYDGDSVSAQDLRTALTPVYNAALPMEDLSGWLEASVIDQAWATETSISEEDGRAWVRCPYLQQLAFDFALADEESGQLTLTEAWLRPGDPETPVMTSYAFEQGEAVMELLWTYWAEGPLEPVEDALYTTKRSLPLRSLTELAEGGVQLSVTGPPLPLDLDTAVCVVELNGAQYEVRFPDFISRNFEVDGMVPVSLLYAFPQAESQNSYAALRWNSFAYPSSAESDDGLLLLVTGILFITTVCAVFQICFTQVRRRLQRIVLLKSVGAETGQIAGMLGWEFLYIWASSLAVGALLGLGGAWAAAAVLGRSQGRELLLTVRPAVLLAALAAGTLALALGMCVPMGMAVGVPLTGRTVRRKPLPPPKRETRQDFLHVTLRGLKARRGSTAGTFALCVCIACIAVSCLFLGFQMMKDYRETVVRDGKPEYLLRAPYAMSQRQRETYLEELEALGVCGSIESYFVGEGIELDRAALEGSPLVAAAAGDTEDDAQADSYAVNLYAIRSGDALFEKYCQAITVGSLDAAAFDAGEQVLLMVPLYRDTGRRDEAALLQAQGWDRLAAAGIETSYYAEYDGVYSRDPAVQVGDVLTLRATSMVVREEDFYSITKEASVTVGAILYYFPDEGIWPVSGTREGYQLVAGFSLLPSLLPGAGITRDLDSIWAVRSAARGFSMLSHEYGNTDFYIRAGEGVERETADTALLVYAQRHYMDIEVYYESSVKLLRDAVNNILLVCLLSLTAVLLALVIFYHTVSSGIEQERRRIGILQALGVSNRRLLLRQLGLGLAACVLSLVLSNLLLWGGVAVYAAAAGKALGNLLWSYPTGGHVLLCAALAVVITGLYILPMHRLRSYLPIDNIRSGK